MDVIKASIHAGLSGHARFELIDLQTGQVEQVLEQHNLILDSGLDAFAVSSDGAAGTNPLTYPQYGQWRAYFAVGTGSTTPAVGQTALTNQVQIAGDNGGFGGEQGTTYSYDAGNNLYKCVSTMVRVLNFSASYNLTEWGLARQNTGSLSIRELFRDGSNNPVAIAVSNGKQLKITHTLTLTLPAVFGAVSIPVTGLGTVNGQGGCWAKSTAINTLFAQLMSNSSTTGNAHFPVVALPAHGQVGDWIFTGQSGVSMTVDSYVSGSKKWVKRFSASTSQLNGNINEFVFGITFNGTAWVPAGYLLKLDAPISKTASNTLSLVLEVSFNRTP